MLNVVLMKQIISFVVGSSAGYVARQVIANNVAPQTTFEIARTWIGGIAIGGAVGGYIQEDVSQQLDKIEQAYEKYKTTQESKEN